MDPWNDSTTKHNVEITQLTKNVIRFTLSNSNASMANAIRRIILAEVPTLAIDIVNVYENTSAFHDEFLVHRLGLIPIDSVKVNEYEFREKCKCKEACSKCTIEYTIEVTCNNSNSMPITHFDIESVDQNPNIPMPIPNRQLDESVENAIPIVTLAKNQSLHLKLIATKGIGKMHAKWIPANVTYRIAHKVLINHAAIDKLPKEHKLMLMKNLDRRSYIVEEALDGRDFLLKLNDRMSVVMAESCLDVLKELGYGELIKIVYDETKFHFYVESVGSLPPEKIVEMALDVLENKLKTLEPQIKDSFFAVDEVARHMKEQGVSICGAPLDLE